MAAFARAAADLYAAGLQNIEPVRAILLATVLVPHSIGPTRGAVIDSGLAGSANAGAGVASAVDKVFDGEVGRAAVNAGMAVFEGPIGAAQADVGCCACEAGWLASQTLIGGTGVEIERTLACLQTAVLVEVCELGRTVAGSAIRSAKRTLHAIIRAVDANSARETHLSQQAGSETLLLGCVVLTKIADSGVLVAGEAGGRSEAALAGEAAVGLPV